MNGSGVQKAAHLEPKARVLDSAGRVLRPGFHMPRWLSVISEVLEEDRIELGRRACAGFLRSVARGRFGKQLLNGSIGPWLFAFTMIPHAIPLPDFVFIFCFFHGSTVTIEDLG